MHTVTRQLQWPTGNSVVEISEGDINYSNHGEFQEFINYSNPDALVAKYDGEFQEFINYSNPLVAMPKCSCCRI
jgi:hypothetical protein